MRLNKQDPTGSYWYYTDGVSPASNVLSDGYSTFTPGISEINGQGSRFYLADASGNSRGLLNGSQTATDGYNWDAFGNLVSRFGSNPTMFAWNVSSGYQTDNDDGLTLLGHRYYDKRTGRFISQDPAEAGGSWYEYASNNPMNKTDPTGLDGIFGDFGFGATSRYAADPMTSAQAYANMGLNRSSSLTTAYQYYSVDLVTTDNATGKVISTQHEFDFAVPTGVNINANYQLALGDRDPYAWLNKSKTEAYFRGKRNGIASGTPGDYKDRKLPKDISPRLRNQLVKLLDHGGNFNGGMVAEGYGTSSWENELIGSVAKSDSDGGIPQLDDYTGQGIFRAGWSYGYQGDPNGP